VTDLPKKVKSWLSLVRSIAFTWSFSCCFSLIKLILIYQLESDSTRNHSNHSYVHTFSHSRSMPLAGHSSSYMQILPDFFDKTTGGIVFTHWKILSTFYGTENTAGWSERSWLWNQDPDQGQAKWDCILPSSSKFRQKFVVYTLQNGATPHWVMKII
jgi:hypothetical protein